MMSSVTPIAARPALSDTIRHASKSIRLLLQTSTGPTLRGIYNP